MNNPKVMKFSTYVNSVFGLRGSTSSRKWKARSAAKTGHLKNLGQCDLADQPPQG